MSTETSSTSKTDAGSAKTDSGSSASGSPSSESKPGDSKPSGGKSGGGRPVSYFSSVSTDEYRSGWDQIFGRSKAPARKPRGNGPTEIALDEGDLTAEERDALLAAFRRKAKARRINLDRRARNGRLVLSARCRLEG